ncbi:zinc finger protein 638 [Microcaecilia unicolor]|uniref:Zinc finger protein 638 n=1 Tax=Microcaecilia unicolor TaxID=1415580 RepID=A0A6P7XCZ5_9AMPH|nr:zinc finger protein 638 [Microcaecilia unicolor]
MKHWQFYDNQHPPNTFRALGGGVCVRARHQWKETVGARASRAHAKEGARSWEVVRRLFESGAKQIQKTDQQVTGGFACFVLFLENCAPVVNSLNFGISSPLLLGPPSLQLIQIKTQLALHQLSSVVSNTSTPACALLNRALLKTIMYNPRGAFPGQRPPRMSVPGMSPARVNVPGMMNQGSFMGVGEMNLQGMSQRMGLQGTPNRMMGPHGNMQRFGGTESFLRMGHQMQHQDLEMNLQGAQHRIDPRSLKEKMNLQETMPKMRVKTPTRWDPQTSASLNISGGHVELTKPISTPQVVEHTPEGQSRYTTESASSILASFGLSNEDLEELSRYPDDQLTPENMPLILRDIRLRKMGNQISSTDDSKNRGRISESAQSNVIDYGHGSKYGYNEDPVEGHIYSPLTNLETRNDYQAIQTQPGISMETQQSTLSCNQGVFPVEEIMRQIGFQNEAANAQQFFQVGSGRKISTVLKTPLGNRKVVSESQSTTPASHPIQVLAPSAKSKRNQNQPKISNTLSVPMVNVPMVGVPRVPMVGVPRVHMVGVPRVPMVSVPSMPMVSAPSVPMVSTPSVQMGTVMNQQNYQAVPESAVQPPMTQSPSMTTTFMKGNWASVMSQSDAQKMKRLPTPSMMNDYYAASPRIFPHLCSLCNVECRHLKDWIQHQNTNTHIESCRQLRQQYPDWNPQVLATLRNEGERNDDQIPKRRSGSSGSSPRRSRRSDSRHRVQRSRSRSPPKFRRTRSRSRSPRRIPRRSPVQSRSPRRRSRSPRKSRSPHKSLSPRRVRRSSSRSKYLRPTSAVPPSKRFCKSPDKKDSQAAAQSLSKVVTSSNKQVSSQAKTGKTSTIVKKGAVKGPVSRTQDSTTRVRKPVVTARKPGAAVTVKKPGVAVKKPSNTLNKPPASSMPGKPSGQSAAKEVYNPLQRFKSKLNPGTIIHISDLPDDGYTDQDIIKIVQPFGKVSDILIIRSKNEAYLETNYKEAAVAAVKFSETVPVLINRKRVKLRIAKQQKSTEQERKSKEDGQNKMNDGTTRKTDKTASSATPPVCVHPVGALRNDGTTRKTDKTVSSATPPVCVHPVGTIKNDGTTRKTDKTASSATPPEKTAPTVKPDFSQSKGSGNTEKTVEPVKKKKVKPVAEEIANSVVLVTNLPDKGYTVEEIPNLAKPFGGVKDLIVLSSHKKAYLQMANETSADSLVKFYACFPMSVAGNILSVKLASKYKHVDDVEAIFTEIIAEMESKEQPDIHEQFVHIRNLPAEQYTEFQLVCMGLRFGKVDNYVVIKNKRKAILQLDSAKAAKTMVSFLKQYPVYMSDHMLKCTLSPKRKLLPGENLTEDETDEESADVINNQEAKKVDGKVASSTEKKETGGISNVRTDDLSVKTSISRPESEKGGLISFTKPVEGDTTGCGTGQAAGELPIVKLKGVIQDKSEPILKESAETEATVTKPEEEHLQVDSKNTHSNPDSKPVEAAVKIPSAAMSPNSVVISAPGELENKSLNISKLEVLDSKLQNPETNKLKVQEMSSSGKLPSNTDNPQTKTGENTSEKNPENSVPEPNQKEELAQSKSETVATVANETKKIVASGDKATTIPQKNETSFAKNGEQKSSLKPDTRKRSTSEKKPILRDYGSPRPSSRRSSPSESSGNRSTQNIGLVSKRSSGRSSSQQEKDLRGDSRNTSKSQERENRSGMKKDDSNKVKTQAASTPLSRPVPTPALREEIRAVLEEELSELLHLQSIQAYSRETDTGEVRTLAQCQSSGFKVTMQLALSAQGSMDYIKHVRECACCPWRELLQLQEDDQLFPFDLDEFVTVDEVVEEPLEEKAEEAAKIVSPQTRKNLPKRGKRKEPVKENLPLEPSSKRSRDKETTLETPKQELSFVTLDEIGDEEDGAAAEAEDASVQAVTDPQGLKTKDEILPEGDPIPAVKDPRSLFTLDEISDEEDVMFQSTAKDSCVSVEEEPEELDKGQPLVTLDEVGEEEESTLCAESSNLKSEVILKEKVEESSSTVVPEENVLSQTVENLVSITTHKASGDNNEQPLVTLDEVNEDEEESMADLSRFKLDLNFVTVDEVGGEEEEDEDIKVSEETMPEEKSVRKAEVTGNEMEKTHSNKQQIEIHGRARRAECERR